MALLNLGGRRPPTIGAPQGRLAPCEEGHTNCVCSQYELSGAGGGGPHHVPALRFTGDPDAAMSRLTKLVRDQPEATIVERRPNYLHAEFTRIGWLGLIDDVELLLEPDASGNGGAIQVRSASRRQIPDFGVNRARVEELREAFEGGE
jgi:uncharacterized protein (DUF1499 family)